LLNYRILAVIKRELREKHYVKIIYIHDNPYARNNASNNGLQALMVLYQGIRVQG
jgi:hypothetical protein